MDHSMKTDWTIIGISGCTNSGKTMLASAVQKHFPSSVIIKQDDYFRSEDSKEHIHIPELNHKNWERLEAVDWEAMMAYLAEILSSPPPNKQSLLIIDGHIIFNHPNLRQLFDKKYFLTMEKGECSRRRSFRVYNPPDIPGYFDLVVWPMFIKNLEDVKANCSNVMYLDGTSEPQHIEEIVLSDIKSYLSTK